MKRLLILFPLFLLCSAKPAQASNALAQSCQNTAAATTTVTCTLNTASLTSGSLIPCGIYWGNVISGAAFSVSDSTNGTYAAVTGSPKNDGTPGNSAYVAWVKNTSTAGSLVITGTVTGSGNHTIRIWCGEYTTTNGWPASPVDTTSNAANTTSSATAASGNVTPSTTGELIVAVIGVSGTITANSFTVSGTGMTRQDGNGATAGAGWGSQTRAETCDNQNSGNTATTCTFNWAGTPNYAYVILQTVFKPNASTTTVRHKSVQN